MARKLVVGVNDMATTHPELAAELVGSDPTSMIAGTGKTLLWKCPNHEDPYPQSGRNRLRGVRCGYCSGDRVLAGFNDMATTHPELAAQLVDTDPTTVSAHTHSVLLWRCPNHDEPYPSKGNARASGSGCGYCSGRRVLVGFNDMATTHPELAAQLVDTDPTTVLASTSRKLAWSCEHHTGVYQMSGERRVAGSSCPICKSRPAQVGESMATTHPELAAQLVDTDPTTIRANTRNVLLWRCPNHEAPYPQSGASRLEGKGCGYCAGKRVLVGFNDMATTHPELAAQLVDTDPTTVTAGTSRVLLWRCPNHETPYPTTGKARARGRGCTFCSGTQGVLAGYNDMATTHPELAAQVVDTDPTTIRANTGRILLWRCPNHEAPYPAAGNNRVSGWGCGYCANRQILIGYNDLATTHPRLAQELLDVDPTTITAGSNSTFQWKCASCQHTWYSVAANRSRGSGCPKCSPKGFQLSQPGYLYLLERAGEQQIGITGDTARRLREHQATGDWRIVDVLGPYPGNETVLIERQLKQWLRRHIGILPGTHENWSTAKLEVRTLSQLMAAAGMSPQS